MTHVVIASGQSVTPDVVARVRHLPCVAVSDAFKLAPWAQALVATDAGWWQKTPEAARFAGERWSTTLLKGPYARIIFRPGINTSTNSGLLGLDYWVRRGAKRVLLLGIDMQGTHFFGPHKELINTTPGKFAQFIAQFDRYAQTIKGCEVINCSPVSALTCFPKMSLDDALALQAEAA